VFVLFIVFKFISEKYDVIKKIIYIFLFFITLLVFFFKFLRRKNLINKIIKNGNTVKMEIIDSITWPRDQYVCSLLFNNVIYISILKVSKKNKMKLVEYCKKGNIVNAGFLETKFFETRLLENKKKDVILIDFYKNEI
jgi:hypothetical protein